MSFTIQCPSGFTFEARPFEAQDVARISRGNVESMITSLLQACHERTISPGANAFIQEGEYKPKWSKVLWADLIYAVVELRRASFNLTRKEYGYGSSAMVDANNVNDSRPLGDILDFDYNCQFCRKKVEWTIDLKDFVEQCTVPITDDAADRLGRGQSLVYVMRDGRSVHWRPSCPEIDANLRTFMDQKKIQEEGKVEFIAKHLVCVEGFVDGKGKEKRELRQLHQWVTSEIKDPIEFDKLLFVIQNMQPTFDNELTVTCNHCNTEQSLLLPLQHPAFMSPSQSPQAKRALKATMMAQSKTNQNDD